MAGSCRRFRGQCFESWTPTVVSSSSFTDLYARRKSYGYVVMILGTSPAELEALAHLEEHADREAVRRTMGGALASPSFC